MVLELDTTTEEVVLWPEWGQSSAKYPEGIKKGSIIMLFGVYDYKEKKRSYKDVWLILI
jgi:hypothetical protein